MLKIRLILVKETQSLKLELLQIDVLELLTIFKIRIIADGYFRIANNIQQSARSLGLIFSLVCSHFSHSSSQIGSRVYRHIYCGHFSNSSSQIGKCSYDRIYFDNFHIFLFMWAFFQVYLPDLGENAGKIVKIYAILCTFPNLGGTHDVRVEKHLTLRVMLNSQIFPQQLALIWEAYP